MAGQGVALSMRFVSAWGPSGRLAAKLDCRRGSGANKGTRPANAGACRTATHGVDPGPHPRRRIPSGARREWMPPIAPAPQQTQGLRLSAVTRELGYDMRSSLRRDGDVAGSLRSHGGLSSLALDPPPPRLAAPPRARSRLLGLGPQGAGAPASPCPPRAQAPTSHRARTRRLRVRRDRLRGATASLLPQHLRAAGGTGSGLPPPGPPFA